MFCTKCGKQLAEGARFCAYCGAPVAGAQPAAQPQPAAPSPMPNNAFATPPTYQPAPASAPQAQTTPPPPVSPAFGQYLEQITQKLNQKPVYVPELNCYQFYCERFSAALAKMKQFVFLTENDTMDFQTAKAYSAACMRRALNIYQGLPRGFQTGVVAYNVICQQQANPSACQFVQQLPEKHMAAFEMPVVVELSSKNLFYCTKKPFWGFAMWGGIRKTAEMILRV